MDETRRPHPFLPVVLAWLVPGAGHLKIGRLWPGLFVFAAIVPLYAGGMALAGFENVSWERHPVYFGAVHVFGGLLTGAAELATRHVENHERLADQTTGVLFTAVACLLNVIAISDVWSRCRRGDPEERAARMHATAAPAPEPAEVPAGTTPAAPPAEVSGG
jgi:hypothetical protein